MATNPPPETATATALCASAVSSRTKMMGEEHYTKRSKTSGQFMAQKKDDAKFKGVRREQTP